MALLFFFELWLVYLENQMCHLRIGFFYTDAQLAYIRIRLLVFVPNRHVMRMFLIYFMRIISYF